jgi:Phage-related lysozyme (muraminidase)
MNISRAGLTLITDFEKLRLTAYLDAVGVWTIGYGHTRSAVPGMQISEARALDLLSQDVEDAEFTVQRFVRAPITQCQFDALVSLVFNIGGGAFKSSTILRLINERAEPLRIGAEFKRWVYGNGKKLSGLELRRAAERRMYLGEAT